MEHGSDASSLTKFALWSSILAPIVMIMMAAAVMLNQFTKLEKEIDWVKHTDEIIYKASVVEQQIMDLERSQREFLITGNEIFLEPYENGLSKIKDSITELKLNLSGNPIQIKRLENLQVAVSDWVKIAGATEIEARKSFDREEIEFTEVEGLLMAGTGRDKVSSIRSKLEEFIAHEYGYKSERRESTGLESENTKIIAVSGSIAIIIISLIAGVYAIRTVLAQSWIRAGHSSVVSSLQGITDTDTLSNALLMALLPLVQARLGSIYIIPKADSGQGFRTASVGTTDLYTADNIIKSGQGLVGHCLASGEMKVVRDIPDVFFDIHTSLGNSKPRELVLIPIKYEGKVNAIIELASLSHMGKKEMSLIPGSVTKFQYE